MSELKQVPSSAKPLESKALSNDYRPQEYRIYRPQKEVAKGAATKWNVRVKQEKYRDVMVFVEATVQTGLDANGNASFAWQDKAKTIKMKLESQDLGAILGAFKGVSKEAKLFHKNKAGNSVLHLTASDKTPGSFYLKISTQQNGKTSAVSHSIGIPEVQVLTVLLQDAITNMYSWR